MTANGSEYKDSRDEAVTLSYNSLQIFTDPYQVDSFQVNGQSIGQWPRIISLRNSILTPIVALGTPADVDWTAPTIPFFNTFLNPENPLQQSSLNYVDDLTVPKVAVSNAFIGFKRLGLWTIICDSLFNGGNMATGDEFAIKLATSTNDGVGFFEVAASFVTQTDAGPKPDLNRCQVVYKMPVTNTTTGFKITVQGNFAGQISSTLTLTRER